MSGEANPPPGGDAPVKPSNDSNEYKYITLPNGLRVLLIAATGASSQESVAGLSVTVHAGARFQPETCIGLAHLLEHLVTYTSSKHFGNMNLVEFVRTVGGELKTATYADNTTFAMEVPPQYIKSAMEVMSDVLAEVDFSRKNILAEINAVDCEYFLRQCEDNVRFTALLNFLGGDGSPKFICGTGQTLGRDNPDHTAEQAKTFFETYYNPKNMTMAVQAFKPISDLENDVKRLFGQIRDHASANLPDPQASPPWSGHPEILNKLVLGIPSRTKSTIDFVWGLPDIRMDYMQKSLDCLVHLLEDKSANGLFDTLFQKGLVTDIKTFYDHGHSTFYSVFRINFTLTDDGRTAFDAVAMHVHQFLHFVRRINPLSQIWALLAHKANVDFGYESPSKTLIRLKTLSEEMYAYPVEHLLCHRYAYHQYSEENVKFLLEILAPDKCSTILLNRTFQNDPTPFSETEDFHGMRWTLRDPPPSWSSLSTENVDFTARFEYPGRHQLLELDYGPWRLEGVPQTPQPINADLFPYAFFCGDSNLTEPACYFHFGHTTFYARDPVRGQLMEHMFLTIVEARMHSEYFCQLAPLQLYQVASQCLFKTHVNEAPHMIEALFKSMLKPCLPVELYYAKHVMRETLADLVHNGAKYASTLMDYIVRRPVMYSRQLAILESITALDMTDFSLLNFTYAYRMFVYGNIEYEKVKTMLDKLMRILPTYTHSPDEGQNEYRLYYTQKQKFLDERNREEARRNGQRGDFAQKPASTRTYVRVLSKNPTEKCSHIRNLYLTRQKATPETRAYYELLAVAANLHIHDCMRRQHSFGCDPKVTVESIPSAMGLLVCLSPPADLHTLSAVDDVLDKYLAFVRQNIASMNDRQLTELKLSFKTKFAEAKKDSPDKRRRRYWDTLQRSSTNFPQEVPMSPLFAAIVGVKLPDFVLFANDALNPQWYIKVSVQVVGYGEKALNECDGGEQLYHDYVADPAVQTMNLDPRKDVILRPRDEKLGKHFVNKIEDAVHYNLRVFL